ncbi:hypothetical protein ACA910_011692 [Epithemia clementina (nom. ined.)]
MTTSSQRFSLKPRLDATTCLIHPSATAASMPTSKPKSPLSAYNLFFQLERKRILDGTDSLELTITLADLKHVREEHKRKGKRVHRKTHGKISFRELARTVANRWKQLDENSRKLLDQQALEERDEHTKLSKEWLKIKNMEVAFQQACINRALPATTNATASNQLFSPGGLTDLDLSNQLAQLLQHHDEIQGLVALQNLRRQIMAQIGALSGIIHGDRHATTSHYHAVSTPFPTVITAEAATPNHQQSTNPCLSRNSLLPGSMTTGSLYQKAPVSRYREVSDNYTHDHDDRTSSVRPYLPGQSHKQMESGSHMTSTAMIVPNDWLTETQQRESRNQFNGGNHNQNDLVGHLVHDMKCLPPMKDALQHSSSFNLFPWNADYTDCIDPDEMDHLF